MLLSAELLGVVLFLFCGNLDTDRDVACGFIKGHCCQHHVIKMWLYPNRPIKIFHVPVNKRVDS